MRILHLYKTSLPETFGGVEKAIDQIASGSSNMGIEVDVLTLTRGNIASTIRMNGYLTHKVPLDFQIASTGFSFAAVKKFKELANLVDLIHYHFPWPFMDLMHFISSIKKPTLVSYQSDIIRQHNLLKIYKPLMYKFLGNVNHIVANSPNYVQTSEVLNKFLNKVSIIPIGLDKSSYLEPSASKLEYWSNKIGSKFFLFVGVLRYYKGLHILIDAAKDINFPIIILGSGPLENELKNKVKKLGINNIFFIGNLSDEDKITLITLSYAFVFPSHIRSEAFGIALLEAAMYGKPLISCEIGTGTTYINTAGETGVVIPPSDPVALRNAMIYLWENPEEALKMGRNAEDRYWKIFTADRMVSSYVELYKKIIK